MTFPWEGGNGREAPTLQASHPDEGRSGRWASEGAISRHLLSATGILNPVGRPGRRWRCATRACVELRRDGRASSGWLAAHCLSSQNFHRQDRQDRKESRVLFISEEPPGRNFPEPFFQLFRVSALKPGSSFACFAPFAVGLQRLGSFRIPNSALHICMIRCSYRRGPWTGPSRLASSSLRIQKISFDAPKPPVLASRSTSTSHARRPWLGRLGGDMLPVVRRCWLGAFQVPIR